MTDLADFLRSRRERLSPADVGLRDSGRRRTPGLRREEVATLAGVSIDYLVRLEQGRDSNPSTSVLGALADALRLNETERRHLFHLAMSTKTPELCPGTTESDASVPEAVLALLARLEPTPAFVAGPYGDVLASNDTWQALVGPTGMLDGSSPNLARFTFLDPRARTLHPDWEAVADDHVARLRSGSLRWSHDAAFTALVDELSTEPEFATRWAGQTGEPSGRGDQELSHPTFGLLRLHHEALGIDGESEHRLVTWLPSDEATDAAFVAATGAVPSSPARLRVVGG